MPTHVTPEVPKKVFSALYDSNCVRCGVFIPKGSQGVSWNRHGDTKGYYHIACPKPAAGTPVDQGQEQKPLGQQLAETVWPFIEDKVNGVVGSLDPIEREWVIEQINTAIEAKVNSPVMVQIPGYEELKKLPDMRHSLFEECLYYIAQRENVLLWGPTQSGKSHMTKMIAELLGLPYYVISLNPQTPLSYLLGYKDAHGIYQESDLYRAFTNGGVYNIDEIDAAGSQILTMLNTALVNGITSFPCGTVEKHKDCVFVATANTCGRGGTKQYERRTMDSAVRERFTFVPWDYDRGLEKKILATINPDAAKCKTILEWCWQVRDAAKVRGVDITATTTAAMKLAKYALHGKVTMQRAAETVVWKGLTPEQQRSLGVPLYPGGDVK